MQDLARCISLSFSARWEGIISLVRKLSRLEGKGDEADAIPILLRILSHIYYYRKPSLRIARKNQFALQPGGKSEQK